MSMMCLGHFVFSLHTAPFQSLRREMAWRHPANSRVGLRPARQFVGPDDESVTLDGVLLPEITGGPASLDALREMAATGRAYVLIDGTGTIHGLFVVESISETGSVFFADGAARRIEFSLSLKRVDEEAAIFAAAGGDVGDSGGDAQAWAV